MGTDTDQHDILRVVFTATETILGVVGLLRAVIALWIQQLAFHIFQFLHVLLTAANNPDWLTAPFNRHHLTGLQLANIRFNRSACGLCTGTGLPGYYERGNRETCSDSTYSRGRRGQEAASTLIYAFCAH
jgi:hypothetical protein